MKYSLDFVGAEGFVYNTPDDLVKGNFSKKNVLGFYNTYVVVLHCELMVLSNKIRKNENELFKTIKTW